jgi:uncharacterized membrane protein YbhN (UPF0104 family)
MTKKLSIAISIIVLAVFVVYFALHTKGFGSLLHVNFLLLLLIAIGNLVLIVSGGIFTRVILNPFGKNIDNEESVYISLVSTISNFFAPAGTGLGVRAVYLKKN